MPENLHNGHLIGFAYLKRPRGISSVMLLMHNNCTVCACQRLWNILSWKFNTANVLSWCFTRVTCQQL